MLSWSLWDAPRKIAEAVVLSGFGFETKERKRLSQNVGTKRQPAAATSGTCTIRIEHMFCT